MHLISSFFVVLALMAPSHSRADRVTPDGQTWVQTMRAAVSEGHATFTSVDLGGNVVPTAVKTRLMSIIDDQVQVWADTILEGDFLAESDVRLDAVETIHIDSVLAGFRVTYSSVAYETSDCDAVHNLASCAAGRIIESTLVSPGLDTWVRDENHFAEFAPN